MPHDEEDLAGTGFVGCSTHGLATKACQVVFVNRLQFAVRVMWVGFDSVEAEYACLEPKGGSFAQGTYDTHLWYLRAALAAGKASDSAVPDGKLLGSYAGPSATVELVLSMGRVICRLGPLAPAFEPDPAWGAYTQRGSAKCGIAVKCYDCVGSAAVEHACRLLDCMLANTPAPILQRLISASAHVGIIGRHMVTSDMPSHTHLKLSHGGRDLDATARGLGGTQGCPITTCGEENLTMVDDRHYGSENILIHEFAHTVMNIGMTADERQGVQVLYQATLRSGQYPLECYAASNADEYWAEGTQAWFEATVRTDVNGGINTRKLLWQRDPGLAALLAKVWGSGAWLFHHDAPFPLHLGSRTHGQGQGQVTGTALSGSSSNSGMPAPAVSATMSRIASNCATSCLPALSLVSCCGPRGAGDQSFDDLEMGQGASIWSAVLQPLAMCSGTAGSRGGSRGQAAHSAVGKHA